MSLLRLSPEVARLRRIGKACSVGELSRSEYRQARRRVIDQFIERETDDLESTVQREKDIELERDRDVTRRRQYGSAQVVTAESVDGVKNWFVLACLVALILLVPLFGVITSKSTEQTAANDLPASLPYSDESP